MEQLEMEIQEHREAQRETIVFKTISAAMSALAVRGMRYLALVCSFVLFLWAMADPSPLRATLAGLFASLVLWPILLKRGGGDGE